MTDIANKLAEARKLIERGWCQEEYEHVDGYTDERCYCVTGAVGLVTVNDVHAGDADEPDQAPAFRETIAAFGAAVGCRYSYEIARWNDYPERTQAEVIEAFRKAEQLARGEV